MSNRSCPLCFVKLSRGAVLVRSGNLVCPSCHTCLELSRLSRVTAAFFGLAVAFATVWLLLNGQPKAGWCLAPIAAVLAYGLGSALYLFVLPDLVVYPRPPGEAFPHGHG
jgi:membrane protein YdbS with pleckstrin-like domain